MKKNGYFRKDKGNKTGPWFISVYELAKRCGIAKNKIYRWYSKNFTPSLNTLQIICEKGFEMSLSEFFAPDGNVVVLTPDIKELLDVWTTLSKEQKNAIKQVILSFKK